MKRFNGSAPYTWSLRPVKFYTTFLNSPIFVLFANRHFESKMPVHFTLLGMNLTLRNVSTLYFRVRYVPLSHSRKFDP